MAVAGGSLVEVCRKQVVRKEGPCITVCPRVEAGAAPGLPGVTWRSCSPSVRGRGLALAASAGSRLPVGPAAPASASRQAAREEAEDMDGGGVAGGGAKDAPFDARARRPASSGSTGVPPRGTGVAIGVHPGGNVQGPVESRRSRSSASPEGGGEMAAYCGASHLDSTALSAMQGEGLWATSPSRQPVPGVAVLLREVSRAPRITAKPG